MSKFKVGQKVKLTGEMFNKDDFNKDTCSRGWNPKMSAHFGEVVTIKSVGDKYATVIENTWYWDIRFLQELEHTGVDIIDGVEFSDYDSILPCGFSITKVIRNHRTVICFVYNPITDQTNKAIARCDHEDTFDLAKGVEICVWKILRKLACNNLKKLGK